MCSLNHYAHHIPEGCPIAVTDDPPWRQGSITYKDSHCLPLVHFNAIGLNPLGVKGPQRRHETWIQCVFLRGSVMFFNLLLSVALMFCAESGAVALFSDLEGYLLLHLTYKWQQLQCSICQKEST